MNFQTTLQFSGNLRLVVKATITHDETTLTHAEVEGDPQHENLLACFAEPILERIAAFTLKAFEASIVEAQ